MIVDERFTTYLRSLDQKEEPWLQALEQEALAAGVPIIRKDTQNFLKFLIQTFHPSSILEVGTAVAFSALLMASYAQEGCRITTIENYGPRIAAAKENIKKAGQTETITLLEGDAQDILPTLGQTFDLVFLDAAKGQYPVLFPYLMNCMDSGSVFVTDNVLQEGEILESRFAVDRRNRTIHRRMREYLYTLTHDPRLSCVILPVGDGLAVCSVK